MNNDIKFLLSKIKTIKAFFMRYTVLKRLKALFQSLIFSFGQKKSPCISEGA